MEDNRKRVQVAFDTTLDMRAEIKIWAARRNISVSSWINRAINERIMKEKRNEGSSDLLQMQK